MSAITWRGKMKKDPTTGLYVRAAADDMAAEVKTRKFRRGMWQRGKKKTIYNAHGRPVCEVRVCDFGNSHHEYDNHQDAVARPDPVRLSAQFEEAADNLAASPLLDAIPLDDALTNWELAKKRFRASPGKQTSAQWARAKADLKASRLRRRLLQGGQ